MWNKTQNCQAKKYILFGSQICTIIVLHQFLGYFEMCTMK